MLLLLLARQKIRHPTDLDHSFFSSHHRRIMS